MATAWRWAWFRPTRPAIRPRRREPHRLTTRIQPCSACSHWEARLPRDRSRIEPMRRPLYDLQSFFAEQVRTAEDDGTRVYEALIGLVTENKDPSKLGRVKVKLPILSEQDSTFWIPIIMQGAGKNRGWFFIPEPN